MLFLDVLCCQEVVTPLACAETGGEALPAGDTGEEGRGRGGGQEVVEVPHSRYTSTGISIRRSFVPHVNKTTSTYSNVMADTAGLREERC